MLQKKQMKQFNLELETQHLLAKIYPTIAWPKVRFYEPLPWFMSKGFVIAMALPATYSLQKLDVHFKQYDNQDDYNLATLVHECFHVFQYQRLATFWDFGYCRRFMVYYLGWYICLWVKNCIKYKFDMQRVGFESYRFHPFEIPAYDMEARFLEWYKINKNTNIDFENADFLKIQVYKLSTETRPPFWALSLGLFFAISISWVKPFLELWRFVFFFFIKKS